MYDPFLTTIVVVLLICLVGACRSFAALNEAREESEKEAPNISKVIESSARAIVRAILFGSMAIVWLLVDAGL